jgi:hypothetical protein
MSESAKLGTLNARIRRCQPGGLGGHRLQTSSRLAWGDYEYADTRSSVRMDCSDSVKGLKSHMPTAGVILKQVQEPLLHCLIMIECGRRCIRWL